ncbi:MAG: flagellar hook protein FlgE [Syntrophales bacterium]
MSSALLTAVSGLNTFSEQISIVSNNIANSETTAYKSQSVSFADLLSQSLSASAATATGSGVTISSIATSWTQGGFSSTECSTDLEINGSGFFIVRDEDGTGTTSYTRNGEFDFNDDGILVNTNGLAIQGYALDDNGNLGAMGNIEVSYEASAPVSTTTMSTSVSLNSELESGNTFATTTTVYDSLGNEIPVTITYTKSATNNQWTWEASISDTYGTLAGDSTGTFTFNTDGTLATGTADPAFTLTLTNGAANQTITWDIYNTDGTTNGSLVQYSGDCVLNDQDQDGSPSVALSSVSVDEEGILIGTYSDGTTKELYQIGLANFANYDGLKTLSGGLYTSTINSGEAVIGVPGSGQLGTITAQSLEMSNVDLTTELANLVKAQRAYQACAKLFTTADEIMQTTVQLKS